jgi:hypothetical protein
MLFLLFAVLARSPVITECSLIPLTPEAFFCSFDFKKGPDYTLMSRARIHGIVFLCMRAGATDVVGTGVNWCEELLIRNRECR